MNKKLASKNNSKRHTLRKVKSTKTRDKKVEKKNFPLSNEIKHNLNGYQMLTKPEDWVINSTLGRECFTLSVF